MAGGSSGLPLRLEVVANDDDDGTNHKFPSSVYKVLSNDDLLMEILLRLPTISLHLFKGISKQWLSLITSPSFTLTRTRIPTVDPPSGLFIGRLTYGIYNTYDIDFVSFDPRIPAKRSILFSFNSKARIYKSCNGLLLCYMPRHGKFSIYNPLIGMFKMLPPKHDLYYERNGIDDMNMAFDPTRSPCYKVVHVGGLEVEDVDEFNYSIRIQTYSSETGVWSVSDDRFFRRSFDAFSEGIYWNGAIHWLNYSEPFHVKLDIVDNPVLTSIQTPSHVNVEAGVHCDRKLFKSHVSLLLLCWNYAPSRHLNIYEMKTGNSEWLVKYFVNLDDMMRPFPALRMPTYQECRNILSIVLGELEEDSFMVIELSGKVLQYKFVSETVSKLLDLGEEVYQHFCEEFIASFAHV